MQNPIGWCCDWLKIPELARRILSQSQYQWLVRAILHQAQGVFPVFVFLSITRVSWFPIIYKVFSYRWVTRPRATCGSLSCNHLNSYVTTQVLLTKQKPKKPLALDAKCLWRDIDAMAISKSLSKLSDFQPAIASPYRVLHQVQGDKQEINLSCCNHNGAQNAVHI